MYSKIKILGHPLHPMLVGFPVAFYTTTLAAFIYYTEKGDIFWFKLAFVANIAGVIMAGIAALPGFIDWLFIPPNIKAKRIGVLHMISNVIALLLYGTSVYVIKDKWTDTNPNVEISIFLTGIGFSLTLIAGFLGWTLVQKHHVGVDPLVSERVKESTIADED